MTANGIFADVPLENPKDDRLGYAPFAKNLADAICNIETDDCLVFALYGPWGSGKTTCMNFILHYIKERPKEEQPIIVRFNPWWFSGHGELLNQFFREFCAALEKERRFKKVIEFVADLLQIASEIPEPTGFVKPTAKKIAKWLKNSAKRKEIWKLREEIRKSLQEQDKRILVTVDDIDRLPGQEIRSLFKVIKAVADFPKTTYLLAFDKDVVVKALEEFERTPGKEYLEKIVQVPFDLPPPDKTSLRKIFFEQLNIILSDTPQDLFDQTYLGNVFWDGIDHFLNTMRNVKRLTNALKVTYPPVKGEVNPADFIAIETLRVFVPEVYYLIRANPDMFAESLSAITGSEDQAQGMKSFHDKWVNQISENNREAIKNLVTRLFPKLGTVFGSISWGAGEASEWRRQLRICSPNIFPIYFRFAVPGGEISRFEMQTILALAEDSKAFGNKLLELSRQHRPDGSTRVSAFLERLEDYTEKDILQEHISNILQALFDVGDELLLPKDEGRGNVFRIRRIVFQLLKRYKNQKERFRVLKEAFSKGRAISMIVSEAAALGQQHGKYTDKKKEPEEECLVNVKQLEELEKIALHKIKDASSSSDLVKTPKLAHILYRWRDWEGEEPVKEWTKKIIASNEGLADFLVAFLSESQSYSSGDRVARTYWRLDPKSIEPFINPSEIIERCRKLLELQPDWLKDKRKIAVETFVKWYDLQAEGKNPEDYW